MSSSKNRRHKLKSVESGSEVEEVQSGNYVTDESSVVMRQTKGKLLGSSLCREEASVNEQHVGDNCDASTTNDKGKEYDLNSVVDSDGKQTEPTNRRGRKRNAQTEGVENVMQILFSESNAVCPLSSESRKDELPRRKRQKRMAGTGKCPENGKTKQDDLCTSSYLLQLEDSDMCESDSFVKPDDNLKTSTPCTRTSKRTRRAGKWADDFVLETGESKKSSKQERLSTSECTFEDLNQQDCSNASISEAPVFLTPVVEKGKRGRKRKSKNVSLLEEKDLELQSEKEFEKDTAASLNASEIEHVMNAEDSVLVKEEYEPSSSRRRRQKRSLDVTSDKEMMSDSSEPVKSKGSQQKEYSCCHCGEIKTAYSLMRVHMASKHHQVWSTAWQEGRFDTLGSFKIMKSIRCLKCNKLCHTYALFVTHAKWCGREEERVDCEVCGKNVRVMSYNAHVRYMHKKKMEAEEEVVKKEETAAEETVIETPSSTGRLKRRAAVKARVKLMELTSEMDPSHNSSCYSKPQYICPEEKFPTHFLEELDKQMKKLNKLPCCYQGCSYEVNDVSRLVAHLTICSYRPEFICNPQEFTCLTCGKSFQLETEVVGHMMQHTEKENKDVPNSDSDATCFSSTDESSEEGSEGEDEKESRGEIDDDEDDRSIISGGTTGAPGPRGKYKKRPVLSMISFAEEHQWSDLFPNWKAKQRLYQAVPAHNSDGSSHHLSQNCDVGIKIQTSLTDFSPTVRLGLFETFLYNESMNTNVGGAVWAMAWCPVPINSPESVQYLALYSHQQDSGTHPVNKCSSQTAVIQLWRFPLYQSKSVEATREDPELVAGFLIDSGPIWDMKWCPTGAWEDMEDAPLQVKKEADADLSRIGLLAVASHDGNVHILSIPQCLPVDVTSNQHIRLFQTTPVATLSRRQNDEMSPCLCLDWHWKEKCGTIAAGFADGVTCLWDLNATSPVLSSKKANGTDCFFPFRLIRSHIWPVKGVAFCQTQLNLLVTCSTDRMVKLWDLNEPECPLSTYHNTLNTGVIWPVTSRDTFSCAGDDCYLCEHNGTILCFLANNKIQTRPMTVHNATVWGMSFNCWLDCLVSCDSVGTVVRVPWISPNHKAISFLRQVLFQVTSRDNSDNLVESPKSSHDTENVNPNTNEDTELAVKLSGQAENEPRACICQKNSDCTVCRQCQRLQRSFLFKDFSTKWKYSDAPILHAKQMPPDGIIDSLCCALHRVAWNTNSGCERWLAVGGQAGILRVKYIEDIENTLLASKRNKRNKHKK